MPKDRVFWCLLTGLFALACSAGGGEEQKSRGSGQMGAGATGGLNIGGGGGTDVNIGGINASGGTNPGCPTSISGKVYDPSGTLPLYNVVVYAPSEPLAPIAEGAACETCDAHFSGRPVAAALSDSAGNFRVENMPAGPGTRIVFQVGKWRREVTADITACTDNPLDASLTRLPRNKSEGNLPKMAIVRGGSDAIECLIRKIGVDDAEFTTDAGDGRVHLYYNPSGNAMAGTGTMASGESLTDHTALYSSLDKMMGYDMVLLGCEGADDSFEGGTFSVQDFVNVRSYADQGGRLFGSHFNNRWVHWREYTEETAPYPDVIDFGSGAHGWDGMSAPVNATIDASFPKGLAMSEWLTNVGGSPTPGTVDIYNGEHSMSGLLHPSARQWITIPSDPQGHPNVPQYVSWPTPLDGAECGRMVFSDVHVSGGSGDSGKEAFPTGCSANALSGQQLALAFMIFDLSSCVTPEDEPPTVPPIIF